MSDFGAGESQYRPSPMLGLMLATVGVYGVVSYSVSQRTQEIGIRSALGAQRWNVLGMVLKQGITMALVGTAVGIVLAFLLFRGLHSVLYGVASTDMVTLVAVSALLLVVAFLASYVPALRATASTRSSLSANSKPSRKGSFLRQGTDPRCFVLLERREGETAGRVLPSESSVHLCECNS